MDRELAKRLAVDRIVPVAIVDDVASVPGLVGALSEAGVRQLEITFRTPVAATAISAARRLAPELLVLAGTVLEEEQLDQAVAAGAQGIVSPTLNPSILEKSRILSVPMIPGVATPSETDYARRLGLTLVKTFPSEPLGGAAFNRALHSVFPTMGFVPTGGITLTNLHTYAAVDGVIACGMTEIAPRELIQAGEFAEIVRRCVAAKSIMASPRASIR